MRIIFIRLGFFFFLIHFISCSGKDTVSVVGKWAPIEVDTQFIRLNHMSPEDLKNLYATENVEFTKEGKFIFSNAHDSGQGNYTYDPVQKRMTTTEKEGKTEIFGLEFLQKNKMILSNETGKMTLIKK